MSRAELQRARTLARERTWQPPWRILSVGRLLDVTGFKLQWDHYWKGERFEKDTPELIKRHYPQAQLDPTTTRHDAFFDAQSSIAELAFYRSRLGIR